MARKSDKNVENLLLILDICPIDPATLYELVLALDLY